MLLLDDGAPSRGGLVLARFGVLLAALVCTVWHVVFLLPLDHGILLAAPVRTV